MPVKFDTSLAYQMYIKSGGSTKFPNSLKAVLDFTQNDVNLNNAKETAYLLATAKAESDYLLTRWEADYLCGEKGVPYRHQPCPAALNYYRSTKGGKSNYYTKGVDSTGIPYFGRGLIQLTNKYNYKRYGDLIGENLVANADLALKPENSYKITSAYLNRKTYKYVNKGDLRQARISVNGGTKGVDRTNQSYYRWLSVLENPAVNFQVYFWTKKRRIIAGIGVLIALLGGGFLIYRGIKSKK